MGLVNEFKKGGLHKQRTRFGFQGTPQYGSKSGLEGYNLSRRDDLECLGYSIMSLIDKSNIPWMTLENKQAILDAKIEFKDS